MTGTNKLPESKLVKTQPKKIKSYSNKDNSKLTVEMRYDDNCRNGHNTFSITANWWKLIPRHSGIKPDYSGCNHDLIEKYAPDLATYIKYHGCTSEGPLYYPRNVTYTASNRDYNKHAPGDISEYAHGIRFNRSVITHFISSKLWTYLKTLIENGETNFRMKTIEYINKPDKKYEFTPNYSVNDFTNDWYKCPFKTITEAKEMCQALSSEPIEFVHLPIAYSKGKAREFDSARYHAIWPEATDKQLSLPKEELEKLLEARLPALMQEFKATMEELGFTY